MAFFTFWVLCLILPLVLLVQQFGISMLEMSDQLSETNGFQSLAYSIVGTILTIASFCGLVYLTVRMFLILQAA